MNLKCHMTPYSKCKVIKTQTFLYIFTKMTLQYNVHVCIKYSCKLV